MIRVLITVVARCLLAITLFAAPAIAQVTKIVTLTGGPQLTLNMTAKEILTDNNDRYVGYEPMVQATPGTLYQACGIARINASTNAVIYSKILQHPEYRLEILNITDDRNQSNLPDNNYLFVLIRAYALYNNTSYHFFVCVFDKATGNLLSAEEIQNAYTGTYQEFEITDLNYTLGYPNGTMAPPVPLLQLTGYCKKPLYTGWPYSKVLLYEKNLNTGNYIHQEFCDTGNLNFAFEPKQVNRKSINTTNSNYEITGTVKDMATQRRYGFFISANGTTPVYTAYFDIDGFDVRFARHFSWDGIDFFYGQLFSTIPANVTEFKGKYFIIIGNNNGLTYTYDMGNALLLKASQNNNEDYAAFLSVYQDYTVTPYKFYIQTGKFVPALLANWSAGILTDHHTYELSTYNQVYADPDNTLNYVPSYIDGAGGLHLDRNPPGTPAISTVITRASVAANIPNTFYWQEIPATHDCEEPFNYTSQETVCTYYNFSIPTMHAVAPPYIQNVSFIIDNIGGSISDICNEPRQIRGRDNTPIFMGPDRQPYTPNYGHGRGIAALPAREEEATTGIGPRVWPNPVSNILHIQHLQPITALTIYSPEGKLVYTRNNIKEVSLQVNLQQQALSAGLYLVHTTDAGGHTTIKKIYKQ